MQQNRNVTCLQCKRLHIGSTWFNLVQTYIDPNDKTCSTRDVQSTFRKEQTFAANTMEEFASANRLSPPLRVTACVEELTVNTVIWFLSLSSWITQLNITIRLGPKKSVFQKYLSLNHLFQRNKWTCRCLPHICWPTRKLQKTKPREVRNKWHFPNKRSLLKTAFTDGPGFDLEKSWEDLGWCAKMFETTSQGHVHLVLTFYW